MSGHEFVLEEVVRVLNSDGSVDPLTDPGLSAEQSIALYEQMVITRAVDERLVTLQRQGRIGFHIGSMGEEATIIGTAAALEPTDWLFPCYREFGALLLRGMPLQKYVDNMFGNANDAAKGRQMPDHYTGRPYRFGSVSSPIGTQITQAVGFAWAARLWGEKIAALVYFGEGATSSNEFHNGANFAGVYKTPTVLVCRNNGWAISVPAEQQTASETFAQKAFAYGLHPMRVDGNDMLAVFKATREALALARQGTPVLMECLTHRLSGHSTSDDPSRYRGQEEMAEERAQDPIPRFRKYLERLHLWSDEKQTALIAKTDAEFKAAVEVAEKTAAPALESMFEDVFAEKPWHLREQLAECLAAPRAAGHGQH